MFRREVIKVSGLVAGSLLLCACAGQPGVGYGGSGGNAAKGGLGSGASAGIGSTDPMTAGTGSRIIFGTTGCKTTCAAGECGPVSNGCGAFVECGGCTLPETCGGSGVPSHCGAPGNPVCKPTTCAALGATCGLQSDGCGGVLDCWSVEAKASGTAACPVSGEQCIDGTCKSTAPQCTKLTCTDYAATPDLCGPVSDGCGGTLDCGFKCSIDKVCGAVSPGKCGKVECEPLSCESVLAAKPAGFCGIVPDGCGGVIPNCATTCTNGDSCGGGGTPDVCGRGGAVCVPLTNAACGNTCGSISDGCGGVVQCNTCTLPETCGGGGTPGVCGAPVCQARTCASVNAECGVYGDGNGCGGTLDCGNPCSSPETCGGGGIPNQCGAAVCVPLTKAQVCKPGMCGPQPDGCGTGMHECGGCTAPNTCGGGGTESVCGAPPCTKLTCAAVGANCGPISDGCNGIIESCGTCGTGQICGAVEPSKCGVAVDPNCTGLCQKIDWTCPSGSETRLTGTVFAPNGTLPLYNALVYVPNASLPSIKQGASCERCEDEDLGKPIAAALTGPDGKFVLRNVPTGVEFPIVVKMGKWRRVVTIPAITRCTNVSLTAEQSRLPRNKNDATAANVGYLNIPKFAVATGAVDAIECVMRKIGVSDTEFTQPTGAGRVHMYRANGGVMGCSRADKISTSSSGVKTCTDSAYYVQNPLKDLFATSNG
ncbi:MAG TPA: hypothetical protein VKP30_34085, partial [Polyangiaceae bacterium]|nr:hypothetical protein [Polyangiaceae bacterium]